MNLSVRGLVLTLRAVSELDEAPNAPVSWQVGTTVAALSERGAALPVDDATAEALEALRNGAE